VEASSDPTETVDGYSQLTVDLQIKTLVFERIDKPSRISSRKKGLVQDAASLLPELCCGSTYLFNFRSLAIMKPDDISRFICHYND
jgi:hypothetical protein